MKKLTPQTLLPTLLEGFAKEIAGTYEMPELINAIPSMAQSDDDGKRYSIVVDVQPTGQAALTMRSMSVELTVMQYDDGVVGSAVDIQYRHHGGGSNGKSREFFISYDARFGNEKIDYLGAIDRRMYLSIANR